MHKWNIFLEQQLDSACGHNLDEDNTNAVSEETKRQIKYIQLSGEGDSTERSPRLEQPEAAVVGSEKGDYPIVERPNSETQEENVPATAVPNSQHKISREVRKWAEIRPSLHSIDRMMSARVKKRKNMTDEKMRPEHSDLLSVNEETQLTDESDNEDVFYANEIDGGVDASAAERKSNGSDETQHEAFLAWKQELEFLVHGGVPKDLRGEVISRAVTMSRDSIGFSPLLILCTFTSLDRSGKLLLVSELVE